MFGKKKKETEIIGTTEEGTKKKGKLFGDPMIILEE